MIFAVFNFCFVSPQIDDNIVQVPSTLLLRVSGIVYL